MVSWFISCWVYNQTDVKYSAEEPREEAGKMECSSRPEGEDDEDDEDLAISLI